MIELIPAIDLIDGRCVRLSQGDYTRQTTYAEDPTEVAKMFEDWGMKRLHVVDLDGAKASRIVNHKALERIAASTQLVVDFGGGLKNDDDLKIAFDCGAQMVTIGSIAVRQPELFAKWTATYGTDKIILGADTKDGRIAVNGWMQDTDEELLPFITKHIQQENINKVICTDITKDGMLAGPSTHLYKEILTAHPNLYLIASGGVSSIDDIIALQSAGVPAVIFGKAIYEGRITKKQLQAL